MDLRYEFDQILAQYGYPVLLVRTDSRLRCSCWNEKTQEADRECPYCFGLGWVPIVEKHTIREEDTSVPESYPFIDKGTAAGPLAVPGRAYYMRHNVKVTIGSLIVEVDWSTTGKPIYNGGGIYEVSHIDPQRFQKGQIVFLKVYVKDRPIEKRIRGIRIASVNGIINYEIAMEG